jgi:spectinomycin phosphotransferase
MLEKPELKDEALIYCLQQAYSLRLSGIVFLPLGADQNTAVYRVTDQDGIDYFLKLRGGAFNQAGVTVPKYLSDQGMMQIIPPLTTLSGALCTSLAAYRVVLYPYVEGQHAFERKLSEEQWIQLGAALKRFHTTDFPPAITDSIPREEFSPQWRDQVSGYLAQIQGESFNDPLKAETAAFLRSERETTLELIRRAEGYAQKLQKGALEFILCHADIHGWNLLIDDQEALYLVDWDTLIFAPKERDLMFIGCGLGDSGYTPQEEEALFYRGYGQTTIDPVALAYYRCERIIEDISAYYDQIISTDVEGEDSRQAFNYLKSNFLPNNTIERAFQASKTLMDN